MEEAIEKIPQMALPNGFINRMSCSVAYSSLKNKSREATEQSP
jgi:hypothetical protein